MAWPNCKFAGGWRSKYSNFVAGFVVIFVSDCIDTLNVTGSPQICADGSRSGKWQLAIAIGESEIHHSTLPRVLSPRLRVFAAKKTYPSLFTIPFSSITGNEHPGHFI